MANRIRSPAISCPLLLKQEPGFIALISVITISALLVSGVLGLSDIAVNHHHELSQIDNKLQTEASALGTAQYALLRYAQDKTYSGNESLKTDGTTCTISPLVVATNQLTFTTACTLWGSTTFIQTQADPSSLLLFSQKQIIHS